MLACIRGKFDFRGKPLGIMDAQLLGSQKTSELILNGADEVFCMTIAVGKS